MEAIKAKAQMETESALRYVDCRRLMDSKRDAWGPPHRSIPCSKVILDRPSNVNGRFLKPNVPQPEPEKEPDPISSCEDKIQKLKQLLESRKAAKEQQQQQPVQKEQLQIAPATDMADVKNSGVSSNKSDDSFQMSPSMTYEDRFEQSVRKMCRKPKKNRKRRNTKKPVGEDAVVDKKKRKKRNRRNKDRKSELIEEHPAQNIIGDDPKRPKEPDRVEKSNKKRRNEKHHNKHKHFKTDSSAPIYFCTETSKLYSNKKSHKKKLDLWSVNTLIEKYVSFLKKGGCVNGAAAALSGAESQESLQFDETKGKFLINASDNESSDDAFSIVFADGGEDQTDRGIVKCQGERAPRARKVSECDSEDSFVICFDSDCENNAACTLYTNDDVFDDSWTSDDDGDDESSDNEDGPPALKSCMKKSRSRGSSPKKRAPKTVSFDPAPPQVLKMEEWKLEYQLARIGHWQGLARDADRFRQRIVDLSMSLDWVFKKEHRTRIYFQRFRPILMRQIREEKEAKAKLKREEEEAAKLKKEEEEAKAVELLLKKNDDVSDDKENVENVPLNILNNNEQIEKSNNNNKEFSHSDSSTELIQVN